ncbi:hypothetical protein P152DRAFT_429286 [Eremomyces bilateralis CBS 781.70]|uniref:Uncharacterized protein n=1 Tax=Eremomyces bilateralis CBS 781.70 TaxID=1392243 RepID=A0A6G1GBQ5_9PEZI|nr:uncharacterized protein P152DRAFT_429286 [Eremomyces bilateralis CBS 781.70]KAF1815376.1 hypothetical protein P152DRAFT_429286 [Eremomyces bilateralis CBS 781.70]
MAPPESVAFSGADNFVCGTCGKKYKSRDSLTRHRHNHEGGPHHVCPICHLNFRRRDLLQRHSRIHDSEDGRRRGQRACARCKKAKAKCSGGTPCSSCLNADHPCSYEPDSETGRLSRRNYIKESKSRQISVGRSETSPVGTIRSDTPSSNSALIDQLTSPIGPWELSGSDFSSSSDFLSSTQRLEIASDSLDAVMEDIWHSGNWLEPTGWPWRHEDLYAQPNLLLDLEHPVEPTPEALSLAVGPSQFRLGATSQRIVPITDISHVARSLLPVALPLNESQTPFSPSLPSGIPSKPGNVEKWASTIEQLITFAFNHSSTAASRNVEKRSRFWNSMSATVAGVFGINQSILAESDMPHLLHHFVKLYFTRFHALWPLFWVRGFKCDLAPPVLYLTLASIGAMYSERSGNIFGLHLQDALRRALVTAPLEEDQDESLNWILQSMLLTMVGSLYFCQKQGFSNAQHLGSILIARARKMNVFSESRRTKRPYDGNSEENYICSELPTDAWIRSELKKRLAFGILRADIFLSILLDTKPTLSSEEINLELPCPDDTWTSGSSKYDQGTSQLWQLRRPSGLYFSDLVRIAMEYDETLPSLHFADNGLILVGLQESVWRFSHDADMAHRLTGIDDLISIPRALTSAPISTSALEPQSLTQTIRRMSNLREDFNRTISALSRWNQSFTSNQPIQPNMRTRSTLLAARLLYHLSFLRLRADIRSLHLLSYEIGGNQSSAYQTSVERTYKWAKSESATQALDHAIAIWRLLSEESTLDETVRAQFNLMALIALHHAAVVVWALAGIQSDSDPMNHQLNQYRSPTGLPISRAYSPQLLGSFAELFKAITPAWTVFSSFSETAWRMAKRSFPIPSSVEELV